MKLIKKIVAVLGLIGILLVCVYYFYIRERYIDVLHTEINMDDFSFDNEGVEEMINWYYETYYVPAISAAIIENGKVSKYISRGKQSKNSYLDVDENTIYQVASLSKMFTGIICNSLAIKGLLNVDKPIIESLENELDDGTKKKLKAITLKNVLHHTSGLGRSMKGLSKKDVIESLRTQNWSLGQEQNGNIRIMVMRWWL